MEKKYLDVDETCGFLGVSRTTLYRLRKEGLPYIQLKGSLKFDRDDLIQWMNSLKTSDKK